MSPTKHTVVFIHGLWLHPRVLESMGRAVRQERLPGDRPGLAR